MRYREDMAQRRDEPRQEETVTGPPLGTDGQHHFVWPLSAVVIGRQVLSLARIPGGAGGLFYGAPRCRASLGGLTIYGGLIVGGLAVALYGQADMAFRFLHLADATAPALMLAYGIGRIGCQVSGDGDWGIPNPHPKPDWLAWAPDWVWSYNFPNNVNAVFGPRPSGYTGKLITEADPWPIFEGFGTYLDPGVYPTSFYETLMAAAIFAFLWSMRKRWKVKGTLFAVYLMFNGVERFWIEKIRVNAPMEFLGMTMTQAELIATLTCVSGLVLLALLHKQTIKRWLGR